MAICFTHPVLVLPITQPWQDTQQHKHLMWRAGVCAAAARRIDKIQLIPLPILTGKVGYLFGVRSDYPDDLSTGSC